MYAQINHNKNKKTDILNNFINNHSLIVFFRPFDDKFSVSWHAFCCNLSNSAKIKD